MSWSNMAHLPFVEFRLTFRHGRGGKGSEVKICTAQNITQSE